MPEPYSVAVLVGSLRPDGLSARLARALAAMAPAALDLKPVRIADLPLYSQEYDEAPPAPYLRFRDDVRRARAVLFVTPEYNRSVPGGLKNAIDVGSRPYGRSVWADNPAAVISQSPGAMGGFGANHALRQSLVFLDMPAMQQPEAYIAHSDRLFDAGGTLQPGGGRDLLLSFLDAFARWIVLHVSEPVAA